jgi:hypothetical protein
MKGLPLKYIGYPKGDDDVIGSPQRIIIRDGQLSTVDFMGLGHYNIQFKVG